MGGGVISVTGGSGDVYFLNAMGKEVIPPAKGIKVKMTEDFPGLCLRDAVVEAQRFTAGAIRKKCVQKTRGHECSMVVKNVSVAYKVKYGFKDPGDLSREVKFNAGSLIIKEGDVAEEFFWVKEGHVEIDGIEYGPGQVFGRAAFSDGVRKRDVYAKTCVTLIAINKNHPDLIKKLPVILEKFAEEAKYIKRVRPDADLDNIDMKK